MQLPEHERAAHREAFRAMNLSQKAEYIFAYYKLPLVLAFVAIVALGSALRYQLTHKEAVLYVGMTNVALEEPAYQTLTSDYLAHKGYNARTQEVCLYQDLYLIDPEESTDHQYSYASRLKLLASIDAEQLDVVIMSRQAYDLLSHSGYLRDLSDLSTSLPAGLSGRLETNDVILSDNQLELELGEAEIYEAQTEQVTNALDMSGLGPFQSLSDSVYLGIIGNTPRLEETLAYVEYLASA